MSANQDIDLIKQYAPILWVHEHDAFLPEDCEIMEQVAVIRKSNAKTEPFKLNQLGDLTESENYYMDIPGIDYDKFIIKSGHNGSELGPDCLSTFFRKKYANNPVSEPEARKPFPKYHARTSEMKVTFRDGEPFSRYFENRDPGVFGNYKVIQYYFYYIFNDSWNKHIGDWDSTLELFIKEDNSRGYAIFHMHHVSWMVEFNGRPQKLTNWIEHWRKVEDKKQMGSIYHLALHPFVFIARGAHGGYPTPGFSIHGLKPLVMNVIAQTDCRQIGKICIFPDYHPITKGVIEDKLKDAQIDTSKIRFIPWEEPIILDQQSWLKYKGLWGTKSKYNGWGGPTGPAQKPYWRMDQRRFKSALGDAVKGEYKGKWILKIFENWHGWR